MSAECECWHGVEPSPGIDVVGVGPDGALLLDVWEPFTQSAEVDKPDYRLRISLGRESAAVAWPAEDEQPRPKINWSMVLISVYTSKPWGGANAHAPTFGQSLYSSTQVDIIRRGISARELCGSAAELKPAFSRMSSNATERTASKVRVLHVFDRRQLKLKLLVRRERLEGARVVIGEQRTKWQQAWRNLQQTVGARAVGRMWVQLTSKCGGRARKASCSSSSTTTSSSSTTSGGSASGISISSSGSSSSGAGAGAGAGAAGGGGGAAAAAAAGSAAAVAGVAGGGCGYESDVEGTRRAAFPRAERCTRPTRPSAQPSLAHPTPPHPTPAPTPSPAVNPLYLHPSGL